MMIRRISLAVFVVLLFASTARANLVQCWSSSSSSVTINPTAGHTLVGLATDVAGNFTPETFTDTSGTNTWTNRTTCGTNGNLYFGIATSDNVAGGSYTVTFNDTSLTGNYQIKVCEIAGTQNPSFDLASANCDNSSPTVNPIASQTLTTATAGDFIIGAVAAENNTPTLTSIGCGPTTCTGTPSTFDGTAANYGSSFVGGMGTAWVLSTVAGLWQVQATDATLPGTEKTEGALIALKMSGATATPTPTATATPTPTAVPTPTVPPRAAITGSVPGPDGAPLVNGTIYFNSLKTQVIGGFSINQQVISTPTDDAGNLVPISLVQGIYGQATICNNQGACGAPVAFIVGFSFNETFAQIIGGTIAIVGPLPTLAQLTQPNNGNYNMGGFKLTNEGCPSVAGDPLVWACGAQVSSLRDTALATGCLQADSSGNITSTGLACGGGGGGGGAGTVVNLTPAQCYTTSIPGAASPATCTISITGNNFTITNGAMNCATVVGNIISIKGAGTGTFGNQSGYSDTAPLLTTVATCTNSTHGTTTAAAGTPVVAAPSFIGANNAPAINAAIGSGNAAIYLAPAGTHAMIGGTINAKSNVRFVGQAVTLHTPWYHGTADSSGSGMFNIITVNGGAHTTHVTNWTLQGPLFLDGSCYMPANGSAFDYSNATSDGMQVEFADNIWSTGVTYQNICTFELSMKEDVKTLFSVSDNFLTAGADGWHADGVYSSVSDEMQHLWAIGDHAYNVNDDAFACVGGNNGVPTNDVHFIGDSCDNPAALASGYYNDCFQFSGNCTNAYATNPYSNNPPETSIQIINWQGYAPKHIQIRGGHSDFGSITNYDPIMIESRASGANGQIQDVSIDGHEMICGPGSLGIDNNPSQDRCTSCCAIVSGNVDNVRFDHDSFKWNDGTLTSGAAIVAGTFDNSQCTAASTPQPCCTGSGTGVCGSPSARTNIAVRGSIMDSRVPTVSAPSQDSFYFGTGVSGDSFSIQGDNRLLGPGVFVFANNGINNGGNGFSDQEQNLVTDPLIQVPAAWTAFGSALTQTANKGIDGGYAWDFPGTGSPWGPAGIGDPPFPINRSNSVGYTLWGYIDATKVTTGVTCWALVGVTGPTQLGSGACQDPGKLGWVSIFIPASALGTQTSAYVEAVPNGATATGGQPVYWSNPKLCEGNVTNPLQCQDRSSLPNSYEFTIDAGARQFGGFATGAVIASTVTKFAGHFSQLTCATSDTGICTTEPIVNIYDGASNTGTTLTCPSTASLSARGSSIKQVEGLAFSAGDEIGIYISSGGTGCTAPSYTINAQATGL